MKNVGRYKKTKLHLNFSSLGPGYTVLPGYTSLHIRLPGYTSGYSPRLPGYTPGYQVMGTRLHMLQVIPSYRCQVIQFPGYFTAFNQVTVDLTRLWAVTWQNHIRSLPISHFFSFLQNLKVLSHVQALFIAVLYHCLT